MHPRKTQTQLAQLNEQVARLDYQLMQEGILLNALTKSFPDEDSGLSALGVAAAESLHR